MPTAHQLHHRSVDDIFRFRSQAGRTIVIPKRRLRLIAALCQNPLRRNVTRHIVRIRRDQRAIRPGARLSDASSPPRLLRKGTPSRRHRRTATPAPDTEATLPMPRLDSGGPDSLGMISDDARLLAALFPSSRVGKVWKGLKAAQGRQGQSRKRLHFTRHHAGSLGRQGPAIGPRKRHPKIITASR